MKRISILCALAVIIVPALPGQGKTVHFKKLQSFLPTMEIKGLERKKPTGQTQSSMGMSTSEAKVTYATKSSEDETAVPDSTYRSIEITVSDMNGMPMGGMVTMAYQQEFENETEDGFERSCTVKKSYKGKESARTGESKECELEFLVGSRYVVKMRASGTDDLKLIHKLAESMDLAGLEKLKEEAK